MPRPVRITAVTILNKISSLADRRAENIAMVEKAGEEGSDIVILPECGDTHRTVEAIAAHSAGRAAVRENLSLSIDSPFLRQMCSLAKKYQMVVIPCVIHRNGPHTFNAALVYGPDGSLLGSYNKSHLAPGEEKVYDPGQHLEVIPTPFGNLGILICWDLHFPEIARVYQLKNADLLIWSTMPQPSFERDFYHHALQATSLYTSLPIAVATYATEDQLIRRSCMNSIILDSSGHIVAGGIQSATTITKATVNLDEKPGIPAHWNLPNVRDYPTLLKSLRRPELYQIIAAP